MTDEPLHNPHDRFFKETLGRRAIAKDFFEAYLPATVVEQLDWERLARQEGSFVDETLRERHADLLFTVPWKGKQAFLYCLFEHQRTQDPLLAYRLLRYMVRIWETEINSTPGARSLSAILPIVLHQGDKAWEISDRFGSLLELPSQDLEEIADCIPDFKYWLVDLAKRPMDDLRGGVLLRAILATVKVASGGEWVERLSELAPLLGAALKEHDVGFVKVCLEYLMRGTGDVDLRRFRSKLEQINIGEIKEEVMTLADQLIQEGQQEEARAIIRRLLTRRFGPLPAWAVEKVEQASIDDSEKWAEKILDAPSLEAVFEE